MSSRFNYQPRTEEAWKSRGEQTGSSFIGVVRDTYKQYQVKKQDNWLRPLPPTWPNPKHYGLDVWVHYGVGPQNATVLCNLKMAGTRCSVCDAYSIADNRGDENAYDLKATRRVLAWFADRQDKQSTTPVAWLQPWTFDRDLSLLCKDRMTGQLYQIDHPDLGYDIIFNRDGEVPNVKYVGLQLARSPSPIEDSYLKYAVENPLPDILIKRSYEEVRLLFEGGSTDEADPTKTQVGASQPAPPAQEAQAPWQQAPQQPAPSPVPQQFQPPPPIQQAPPPPPPVEPEQAFCNAVTVGADNSRMGCAWPSGHGGAPGQHYYSRLLPPEAPPPPPIPQQFQPPPPPPPQSGNTEQAGGRVAALRERFGAAK